MTTHRWILNHPKSTFSVSALTSAIVHAALIGGWVVATLPSNTIEVREIPEIFATFLVPPKRTLSQDAQAPQIQFNPEGNPSPIVKGAKLVPAEEVVPIKDEKQSGMNLQTNDAAAASVGMDSVFTEIEVDSAATRYAWSAAPAYPQEMLDAKREGYVKAQWIVDEFGYADTATFKLIDWTSNEFAKSVRDALPFMRFSPAKVQGKAVKQLVQQDFTFRITTALVKSESAENPRKPEQ